MHHDHSIYHLQADGPHSFFHFRLGDPHPTGPLEDDNPPGSSTAKLVVHSQPAGSHSICHSQVDNSHSIFHSQVGDPHTTCYFRAGNARSFYHSQANNSDSILHSKPLIQTNLTLPRWQLSFRLHFQTDSPHSIFHDQLRDPHLQLTVGHLQGDNPHSIFHFQISHPHLAC